MLSSNTWRLAINSKEITLKILWSTEKNAFISQKIIHEDVQKCHQRSPAPIPSASVSAVDKIFEQLLGNQWNAILK